MRDVRDEINVLPLSQFDDELRVRTAMAIYRDPALQKYSLDPQAPIRIVVENGNVRLYGVVDSAMDRQIAEMRAREVAGCSLSRITCGWPINECRFVYPIFVNYSQPDLGGSYAE